MDGVIIHFYLPYGISRVLLGVDILGLHSSPEPCTSSSLEPGT